ncbi:hypothetical protein P280DRAFT_413317 [Massarina eburnea CBS 473.64]|uniref:C2H2-type domain-containing protein n=1 Tax=Massarina eburnea CBS 473.64 TaxID=1395130 RepID=A0A6A6RJL8_9PLEO|nr:hypothetical protein P280DRAFT_413317 [Massarina eburnea CBS 473.64]
MQSIDTRPQPVNGQRREQRHPEDASTNNFIPVSSGNFLLPNDQGQFTFSAEPDSIINYGSMTAAAGQDAGYTPNTGSSFDSSLHPEAINQTYPPVNVQMQLQNYTLSPGANSRNGYSVSPSHSVDHLSPDYMSDSSYQNVSSYATPSFNNDFLSEFSNNLSFGDSTNAYTQYQEPVDMSMLTGDSLATFNAQPTGLSSNVRLESHSQLMSPCPTSHSSPIVTDDVSRNAHLPGAQYMVNEYHLSSTPPSRATQQQQSTPSKQQQHSPPLTNSPSNRSLRNPQPRTHLASPIVRVENYGGRESPSPSDTSRPVSKRSHGSKRSNNHLSPYPNDESSEDDDDMHQQVRVQPVVPSMERNEDGSWAPGQAGLGPEDRQAMGDVWVQSLEEIIVQRLKVEKKLEVQDWLSKSEAGSEVGEGDASSNLLKPFAATGRRRAKSTNDATRRGFGLGVRTDFERVDDSGIPGPGVYINEGSEYDDYDDYDDDMEPESPPAEIDINASRADHEVSAFPSFEGGLLGAIVRPWADVAAQPQSPSTRYQPPTSNAAMMRFRKRAKDVESASLAATVGSRRLSESDLGSIRAAPGVIKVVEPDLKKQKERQRRPSFLENILPKRTPTNYLKRKGSITVQQSPDVAPEKAKEPTLEKPKRMGSWGRPKSPRLDTNLASQGKELGPQSSTNLSATNDKWYRGIRRSRSRSDIGKSPGLAELMTQHGGPPMPMLASPMAETEATKPTPQPSPGGDDDEDESQEAVTMDLAVRSDPIIPTYEGFKTHAHQLNPRLTEYMVERITQEQIRRYKRLLEFKVKHLNAVKNRNCPSIKFCPDLGGESKQLAPRVGNKDSDAPFIGFQVTAPGSSEDDGEPLPEGTVISAQFPSGVPLPPVKRLPAEFECPLCFKVKQFYKPSDWTKHVHEDVQPFTCTFPHCGEPKSFKRKADWVRHENERHRQLEHWTCEIADCNHTCYRKDNFVQHLVREHKIAEPRQRTAKGANKDAAANGDADDIWSLVARCRRDTTKQPKDEPCRFCGNICTTWKKLTVHLAKHMEQISMPILPLVEQKQMSADTIISPVVEIADKGRLSATPNRSPIDNPSRYNPNASTLAPGIDPSHTSFGKYTSDPSQSGVAVASNMMHTYPPPQMVASPQTNSAYINNYTNSATENGQQVYNGRTTYPGLDPSKTKGTYVNNLQIPSHQSFMNGNMANRFPITPVSAVPPQMQQQQGVFTDSPVDATPYSTDALGSSTYFAQEAQGHGLGMGFDAQSQMQYQQHQQHQQQHQQQGAYHQNMAFMTPQQQNYHYQGQ